MSSWESREQSRPMSAIFQSVWP